MAWVTPKTNWETGDLYDPEVDYERVKGDIEYLWEFSGKLYAPFDLAEMEETSLTGFPYPEFFNNVVENVETLGENTFMPDGFQTMRHYAGNGTGWGDADLNIIEGNLALLYAGMNGQWNILPKLQFEIGGSEF